MVPHTMLSGTSSDTKPNRHELEHSETQSQSLPIYVWLLYLYSKSSFAFLKMMKEEKRVAKCAFFLYLTRVPPLIIKENLSKLLNLSSHLRTRISPA